MGAAGEQGLFQLMPSTAVQYGVSNPFDPVANTQGGVSYLADLYDQFGNWVDALTAYNWGPGNVSTYGAAAAPASTKQYVANALASAGLTEPATTGATAPAVAPSPSIDESDDSYADESLMVPLVSSPSPIYTIALLAIGVYFGARLLFAD